MIVGLASLKSTRQDGRLGTQGRDKVVAGVERQSSGRIPSWENFLPEGLHLIRRGPPTLQRRISFTGRLLIVNVNHT